MTPFEATATAVSATSSSDPFSVLLVDDEEALLQPLVEVLEDLGYTVTPAKSGNEALAIFKSTPIDLVVTDVRMPNGDGNWLGKQLRSLDPNLQIIFMSGYADFSDLCMIVNNHAYSFLQKPFGLDSFRSEVKQAAAYVRSIHSNNQKSRSLSEQVVRARQELAFRTERLEIEQERLAGILADATFGFIAIDDAFTVHNVNPWMTSLFAEIGVDRPIAVGDTLAAEYSCPFCAKVFALCSACRDTREPVTEYMECSKTEKYLELHAYPLNFRGEQSGFALLVNDKTELQQLQVRLHQTAKLASIGELAAGVAHEINNPLAFVRSNLHTLNEYVTELAALASTLYKFADNGDSLPALDLTKLLEKLDIKYIMQDSTSLVEETNDGIERVAKIVRDLKTFARADNAEREDLNVNQAISDALNLTRNELKYTVTVQTDLAEIPILRGFPQQLVQVFTNLFVNAAQAMPEKGTLTIITAPDNDDVLITVTDTGSGIEETVLSRIFDPFYTTKAPGKGTGMGLSISFGIIERHGGTITASSKVGIGTTFEIRLPVNPVVEE